MADPGLPPPPGDRPPAPESKPEKTRRPRPEEDRPRRPRPEEDRPRRPRPEGGRPRRPEENSPSTEKDRPRRPPQEQAGENKPEKAKKAGGRKPTLHPLQAFASIAVIIVLFVVYSHIRNTDAGILSKKDKPSSATFVSFKGTPVKIILPDGWKIAKQKTPASARVRWAAGRKGANAEALFVTAYDVPKGTDLDSKADRDGIQQALQQGLRATGAPKGFSKERKDIKIDNARVAWEYAYKASGVNVRTVAFLHNSDGLIQLSCQWTSKTGEKDCASVFKNLKISR